MIEFFSYYIMSETDHIQKLIDDLRNEVEEEKILYFNKIGDFLKWTLTISLGSFLWIGGLLVDESSNICYTGRVLILIGPIFLFGLSFIVASIAFILILRQLADKLDLTLNHLQNLKENIGNGKALNISDKSQSKIIDRLISMPRKFSTSLIFRESLLRSE